MVVRCFVVSLFTAIDDDLYIMIHKFPYECYCCSLENSLLSVLTRNMQNAKRLNAQTGSRLGMVFFKERVT